MVLQYLSILSYVICISLQSFIAYLFIKYHCTQVEAVTPEQEEGEPDTVGDDTPLRIKAGTYASFHLYF
jgi:hypothetical protein